MKRLLQKQTGSFSEINAQLNENESLSLDPEDSKYYAIFKEPTASEPRKFWESEPVKKVEEVVEVNEVNEVTIDLPEYEEKLKNHDWFYSFSDDLRVFQAGKDWEEELRKLSNSSMAHKNLWDSYVAKRTEAFN